MAANRVAKINRPVGTGGAVSGRRRRARLVWTTTIIAIAIVTGMARSRKIHESEANAWPRKPRPMNVHTPATAMLRAAAIHAEGR
nr:hypothetical protein GCM10025732_37610 [Glycomyces mayteni]